MGGVSWKGPIDTACSLNIKSPGAMSVVASIHLPAPSLWDSLKGRQPSSVQWRAWCCGPQNCRSEEGHVRLEGRWQRKQPAAVFSILLHFSSVSLVSMFFNSDSVASSVKTSPLVFFSNFPFVVTMFSCNALQKTFLSLTSKSSHLRVLRAGISEKADLLLFPFLLFRAMHPCRL